MARTTVSLPDDLHERIKNADITVSKVLQDALRSRLSDPTHHLVNTNEEYLPSGQTGAGVYGHGIVATFANENNDEDVETYGGHIDAIESGDRIYSYENDVGVRAFGIALEDGDSEPVPREHRLFHPSDDNTHEFHVPVHWVAVLEREDAITTDEIEQITGHPAFARGARAELDVDKHYPELLRDVILGRAD
jgi:hypothetical protein